MLNDYPFHDVMNDLAGNTADGTVCSDTEMKAIYNCIDHTTLSGTDNEATIADFCNQTLGMAKENPVIGTVAAVCVYPPYVKVAHDILVDSGVKVASVAGSFPSGQLPVELKLKEVQYAIDSQADEVDFVINRGFFLQGKENEVHDEIRQAKTICGNKTLKVIIECCELGSLENVYHASMLSLLAGADFVKTSTGKGSHGATPETAWAMLSAVRDYGKINKTWCGFKAAGGVASVDDASLFYKMARLVVYADNINNHVFRIGTSRLTPTILEKLTH